MNETGGSGSDSSSGSDGGVLSLLAGLLQTATPQQIASTPPAYLQPPAAVSGQGSDTSGSDFFSSIPMWAWLTGAALILLILLLRKN